ncbi:unnamed protein product [Owenia fusiformis]|uniref:Uncharacterized protein n=1 Tax=Owenia fusiformis TaxID=6347 RepID=A0A8J1XJF4_OWEFU|nr:unnamed protein product [Owenia fusiformis]
MMRKSKILYMLILFVFSGCLLFVLKANKNNTNFIRSGSQSLESKLGESVKKVDKTEQVKDVYRDWIDKRNNEEDEINIKEDEVNIKEDEVNIKEDQTKIEEVETNIEKDRINIEDGTNIKEDQINLKEDETNIIADQTNIEGDHEVNEEDQMDIEGMNRKNEDINKNKNGKRGDDNKENIIDNNPEKVIRPGVISNVKEDKGHELKGDTQNDSPQNLKEPKANSDEDMSTILKKAPYAKMDLGDVVNKPKDGHNHVFFLKTHKTGSSTVQGIVMRYGDKRNLTFALPRTQGSAIAYPRLFSKQFVQPLKNVSKFDILCNHLRYHSSVHNILHKDTINFAILRNPVGQFTSSFFYRRLGEVCYNMSSNVKNSLGEFLNNVSSYTKMFPKCKKPGITNMQLFDLGMEENMTNNKDAILLKIQEIERNFHFVLISDYMKESLILMKDILGWSIDDIAFFDKNVRLDRKNDELTELQLKNLQSWNHGDFLLYEHFNKTFWKKVHDYGYERLQREVEELTRHNDDLYEFCVATEGSSKDAAIKSNNQFGAVWMAEHVNGFILRDKARGNKTCEQLARYEVAYTHYVRGKMKKLNYL